MPIQITDIPRIRDGVTSFSERDINPIINTIAENIEALADLVDSVAVKENLEYGGFRYYDKGFTTDCKAGMLVSLSDAGVYVPAKSKLSNELREDGTYVFSRESNVAGVLLTDVDGSGGGVILRHGIIKEPRLVNKLAPELIPGDYYLTEAPSNEEDSVYTGVGKHKEYPDSPTDIYCYTLLHSSVNGTFILVDPDRTHYNTTSEIRKLTASAESKILQISTNRGVATIKFEPNFGDVKEEYPGFAISEFTDTGVTKVPVVNKLIAGTGVRVTQTEGAPGEAVIACTQNLNSLIDVSTINLDGAYLSTAPSSGAVSYVFPAGVASALLGSVRIPHSDAGFRETYIVLSMYGNGGNSQFSGVAVSVQPCDILIGDNTQQPITTSSPIGGTITYGLSGLSTEDSSEVYTMALKLDSPVTPNSLVSVRLSASNPSSSIYLASISIKLS